MNYAKVIAAAWQGTSDHPKLKWFTFVPSFVAVLIFIFEVLWQLYLYFSEFGVIESSFSIETIGVLFSFLIDNKLLIWAIILVFFVIFFGFIIPSLIQGTLILGVHHGFAHPDRYLSLRQKVIDGFNYFFRLFELNAVLSPFSFISIGLFVATFYRYFHENLFQVLLPLIVVHIIISFFMQVFFAFSPYFIVVEDASLADSFKKSISLVFLNFGTTLAIILLMFLVNLRVIFNVIVILGVPIGILVAFSYASPFAIFFSVVLSITLIAFTAYLTAIIEVFSTAVWERTFTVLRKKQDQLVALKTKDDE